MWPMSRFWIDASMTIREKLRPNRYVLISLYRYFHIRGSLDIFHQKFVRGAQVHYLEWQILQKIC